MKYIPQASVLNLNTRIILAKVHCTTVIYVSYVSHFRRINGRLLNSEFSPP